MTENNINTIIQELEIIVEDCIQQQNPHGLFAALYLKVTRAVWDGIQQQHFEDNARMEQFDVLFAQRYISAYQARMAGKPTTASWQVVFDAMTNPELLSIQHLLLGMNAHINFDLGIVAAQVSQNTPLENLKSDFNKINDILLDMLETVQTSVNKISPMMWVVDWIFTKNDEQFAGFSMRAAREYAWKSAQLLDVIPKQAFQDQLELLDRASATFGREMVKPRRFLRWLTRLIRRFEKGNVGEQIRAI